MEQIYQAEQALQLAIKKIKINSSVPVEQIMDKIRPVCMAELKKQSKYFLEQAITEVYSINSFRTNIVPLYDLLSTIEIRDEGKWGFVMFVNEDKVNFIDSLGEPVYRIQKGYEDKEISFYDDKRVHNLDQYWRTPIGTRREDDFYSQIATQKIVSYIYTTFVSFIIEQFQKASKGGR